MKTILAVLFVTLPLFASSNVEEGGHSNLESMKLRRRFGIGVAAAGGLSVLGIEADINFNENLSVSGGIGTGLDYSTFTVKGKYHILGESVSPYLGLGFGRWWTNGTHTKNLGPAVLANKFLDTHDYSQGFSVWMVYPALGVQFFHALGLSVYAEVQYLFKLFNFANGTYAGMGVYWYF